MSYCVEMWTCLELPVLSLGTLRYGDHGLRLDARFSLAETLGRVHNEWRENVKLRSQTTDNRLQTKSEGQLYTKQTQNAFYEDLRCSGFYL